MSSSGALSEELCREFRENGAVRLKGFLDEHWQAKCREAYQWSFQHPAEGAGYFFGSRNVFNQAMSVGTKVENATRKAFLPLVRDGPFAEAAARLFGSSEKIWYFDHEMIAKRQTEKNKKGTRVASTKTLYHQDSSFFSFNGPDLVGFWMCLDGFVPKESCLHVVKGSHLGPMYDTLLTGDKGKFPLPPIPDVEKQERAGEVELLSWELEPGDVLAFHYGALHGGAQISDTEFSGSGYAVHPFYEENAAPVLAAQRRTLVLRFFGKRVFYKEILGGDGKVIGKDGNPVDFDGYQIIGSDGKPVALPMPWLEGLKHDEPFWHADKGNRFLQVFGGAAQPSTTSKL